MAAIIPINGALVLWHELPDRATAQVLCFGRKRHYRKAGGCRHVDEVLASLRPELRAKTTVVGWGGKGGEQPGKEPDREGERAAPVRPLRAGADA